MKPPAAHQSQWEISEVVFGIPMVISIILGFVLPLSISHGFLQVVLVFLGIILFAGGVMVIVAARRELARLGQPTEPGKPTTRLVTSGAFSISRNPLYLGVVILIGGLGLLLNSWWLFLGLVPSLILCHVILIFPEERYLSSIFGEDFTRYTRSVYRWFGRK